VSGYLLALLGIAGSLCAAAIGDMVSEEARDRLDHLPQGILRLGARRLDVTERAAIYDDEWLPELTYILQGDEARPVTRLYHGTRFAFGILIAARRIARDLHRTAPLEENQPPSLPAAGRAEQLDLDDRTQLVMPGPAGSVRPEPIVLRMLLGAQLRRLREAAGITLEQAGYEIRASRSKIGRMETGRIGVKKRDVQDLLTLYGVTDEHVRAGFLSLAGQSSRPDWWSKYGDILPDWFEPYLGLESAAATIRSFDTQFVPGLFQTRDYARTVTWLGDRGASAEEIERRVGLRLARQELLTGARPPWIWAVMDEAVLRRPVGGVPAMRAQLRHLMEVAAMPQVTLQVMPFAGGGRVGASGSFTVLRFGDHDLPDVVYIEQLTSALYLEQRSDVEHYLGVMEELSGEALSPDRTMGFIRQAAQEMKD
jgi:transcriptional regulator with XRE-family HTH domain